MAISDTIPLKQYIASSGETVFSVPNVLIYSEDDVKVYQRASTAIANDPTDILILTTNYTVSGVGNPNGFTMKAPA